MTFSRTESISNMPFQRTDSLDSPDGVSSQTNGPRGISHHDRAGRDVLCDCGANSNHRVGTDRGLFEDYGIGAECGAFAEDRISTHRRVRPDVGMFSYDRMMSNAHSGTQAGKSTDPCQ